MLTALIQSCHAAMEATRSYPPTCGCIPNLIVLGVENEQKLLDTKHKLDNLGIKSEIFVEPDLNNQHTALATEPIDELARKVFRNYKLLKG